MFVFEEMQKMSALLDKITPGDWYRFLPNGEDMDDPIHGADVRVCQGGKTPETGDEDVCVCCLAMMGDSDGKDGFTKETQERWIADADFVAQCRTLAPLMVGMLLIAADETVRRRDAIGPGRILSRIGYLDRWRNLAKRRPDVQRQLAETAEAT